VEERVDEKGLAGAERTAQDGVACPALAAAPPVAAVGGPLCVGPPISNSNVDIAWPSIGRNRKRYVYHPRVVQSA
jgi:hypothetical protein